jgi:NAD(P)-dependent dehydrogenase (short-subunit alcohol dehydrogenase family)
LVHVNFDLTGKVAVVTGASRGLGIEFATTMAEHGADIALMSLDVPTELELMKGIAKIIVDKTRRKVKYYGVDVSKEESVKAGVAAAMVDFGQINILVNSAGCITYGPVHEIPLSDWEKTLSVDLTGTFLMMKEVANAWMIEHGGKIVNISSVSALRSGGLCAAYCAAKKGVVALTEAAAVDWAKYNIFVNTIAPGSMANGEMSKTCSPEQERTINAGTPMGRRGMEGDLSGPLLLLVSDANTYITGATLPVDGGMIIESF